MTKTAAGQENRPASRATAISSTRSEEKGSMLLVVVFIATAIAGLAAIVSGRVVAETKNQTAMEQETQAFNSAYAQIHLALNIVNTSPYDDQTRNLVLQDAILGVHGGTVVEEAVSTEETSGSNAGAISLSGYEPTAEANNDWIDHPDDPPYGVIGGTSVRVYRGRDYIQRLHRLNGDTASDVDPLGDSDAYYVLEAAGRAGGTIRLVSALVRENQPFSSFVFFQNRATLGVSGAPRGLIHTNNRLEFYFPNGQYVDTVSAVNGFGYQAGATEANTNVRDGNPAAQEIILEAVDFDSLKAKADLYLGDPGLDAEIKLYPDGTIRIRPHSPPRYEQVEKSYTYQKYLGQELVTVTEEQQVKVGEQEVTYTVTEKVGENVETYYVWEDVQVGTTTETHHVLEQVQVGETTETRYRTVQVQTGTQEVVKTREEPVYEEQTVTKYRKVLVWESYETGGGAVGGSTEGELGEWVWVDEPYEVVEMVQVGTETVTWTETEPVYTTVEEPYTVTVPVYEEQQVEKTRTVPVYESQQVEKTKVTPIYEEVVKTEIQDVYEWQDVEVEKWVDQYEEVTVTYTVWELQPVTYFDTIYKELGEGKSGTIFIDGRVTRLDGQLQGRLSIVGTENVRITGDIQYVDKNGQTAMKNGKVHDLPYERNPEYEGKSVLGVIAKDDIVLTNSMPDNSEINGTLMSVTGRVGIDGFWADETGELHKDAAATRNEYLTDTERLQESAYDSYSSLRTQAFTKNSLRRLGGAISNNRILETYIRADSQGYATVDSGFKRGAARYDINLLFNPPPNFVEVPRPVVTAFAPIVLVRNNDS